MQPWQTNIYSARRRGDHRGCYCKPKQERSFVSHEVTPEGHAATTEDTTEEAIDRRIREYGVSIDHAMGSCAMGRVVDSHCRGKGVKRLIRLMHLFFLFFLLHLPVTFKLLFMRSLRGLRIRYLVVNRSSSNKTSEAFDVHRVHVFNQSWAPAHCSPLAARRHNKLSDRKINQTPARFHANRTCQTEISAIITPPQYIPIRYSFHHTAGRRGSPPASLLAVVYSLQLHHRNNLCLICFDSQLLVSKWTDFVAKKS
ncbi:hypothetical protein EDD36DRAFT_146326 [Exophiala viscosa]|uniref:Glucose-methanol-choline oxidoreductase C-terminal domain-containing protein n=1 Tax=Exophiala viscosa TaxID=2486360 RepID=A0AAN6E2N8_9EURO|nr:hypothetical protein EDD36DRAFT_146326 [Exophiala viscosa]